MSHAHDHDPTVPRGALVAAALLIIFSLSLTGAVSWGFVPQSANPDMQRAAAKIAPLEERSLTFRDREDGAVVVTDADSGEVVTVVGYGEQGFVRATLRRLAKVRIAKGIGAEPPFTLRYWENGALSLHDPETGNRAEIHGFGADHSAAFAAMLKGTGS